MASANQISELKRKHETLYEKAVRDQVFLLNDECQLKEFVGTVDSLLGDVVLLSTQVTSLEDYNWLSDAALKWQFVFSSLLNLPKSVQSLSVPDKLESSAIRFWSTEEVRDWFDKTSYQQSVTRKLNKLMKEGFSFDSIPSREWEMLDDWLTARTIFAAQVLEGRINFTRQIGPASYHLLEEEWLTEVKRTKAYFIWNRRDNKSEISSDNNADYYAACEEIRHMLEDREIKASPEAIDFVKGYLEKKYLNANGRFDPWKSEEMLRTKAHRVSETSGEKDHGVNWTIANTYCKMFYDNIIPAVVDKSSESTLLVLKAFQYSKAPENRYLIINCFEVALAIYFLDVDLIQALWKAAKGKTVPEVCSVSEAAVKAWPGDWYIPEEIRQRLYFDPTQRKLVFLGVMTKEDRALLLESLPEDQHGAVEELFEQSRLLPRESTL